MDAKTFALLLVFIFVGIWLGFNLEKHEPGFSLTVKTAVKKPVDTHPLGSCQPGVGIRQVRDVDLPRGPLYLTYQGRTIGVEYQLTKDEIAEGKSWPSLPIGEASINHLNLTWVGNGDDGYKGPHYDLRLYSATEEEQQQVNCRS